MSGRCSRAAGTAGSREGDQVHRHAARRADYSQIELLTLYESFLQRSQPLVILEAYASGVPVSCTDLGSAAAAIEGGPGEDRGARNIAASSRGVAVPQDTARALVDAARDAR